MPLLPETAPFQCAACDDFAPPQAAAAPLPVYGASGDKRLFLRAGRQLFASQLQLIHLPVAASGRQQLLVTSALNGLTAVQYQDRIGLDDGR